MMTRKRSGGTAKLQNESTAARGSERMKLQQRHSAQRRRRRSATPTKPDLDTLLTFSPLTPTLSPLRGEGVARVDPAILAVGFSAFRFPLSAFLSVLAISHLKVS